MVSVQPHSAAVMLATSAGRHSSAPVARALVGNHSCECAPHHTSPPSQLLCAVLAVSNL